MGLSYHKSVKKSIIGLCAVIFLFSGPGAALARTPNDSQYFHQAPMWNQINASAGWDYTIGSRTVTVAIIDTGADINHPDLQANIWQNADEIPGNGIDDDHNGYIDDINGWNFVENDNDVRTKVEPGSDPSTIDHGTVVAGLLGAVGNNMKNGTGINWEIRLMILRAMNSSGSGSFDDVEKAVNYAVDNGAKVIGMSFVGGNDEGGLRAALKKAYDRGVIIVAAAGNDRGNDIEGDLDVSPLYPICFDKGDSENWLLGTTSVDASDHLSTFANYGSCVDLVAPGEKIYSTEFYDPGKGYSTDFGGRWQGTSFTVPLVAGAAALIEAVHPEWKPKEIIKTLLSTADDVEPLNLEYAGKVGYGRLNLGKALAKAVGTAAVSTDNLLYYFNGNKIYKYILPGQKTVYLGKADTAILDIGKGPGQEAVLLLKRVVRVLKSDGVLMAEFPIAVPVAGKTIQANGLEISPDGQVVVDEYNPKSSLHHFVEYSLTGEKLKEISVRGKISSWRLDQGSGELLLANLIGSKLEIKQVDWEGNQNYFWSTSGVAALQDWQSGELWGSGRGSEIIMLLRRGNRLEQLILDITSGSFMKQDAGAFKQAQKWRYWVIPDASSGEASILRYLPSGGEFDLFKAKAGVVGQIKLPKLY